MNQVKSQVDILSYFRHYHKYGKIIEQSNVCDLIFLNFKPQNHIKKISKNQYIKIKRKTINEEYEIEDKFKGGTLIQVRQKEIIDSDGEVFEMIKTGERNKRSLRKIFNELRYLINSNFIQEDNTQQVFITLTYKENMQDYKQLYHDFDVFYKRLRRAYKDNELAYIVIVEPQGRGAWHAHLLLKVLSDEPVYFDYNTLYQMWGHGGIYVEKFKDVDNIGSYFVAYMSNAEIDDNTIEQLQINPDDIKEKDGKRYIKGTRLSYYKDYMQIYRHSRNVKKAVCHTVNEDKLGITEYIYPEITYQSIKEIPIDDDRVMKIGKEQRRKNKKN